MRPVASPGGGSGRLCHDLSSGSGIRCKYADYSYLIGPGDNVNIVVWRNPELSMSVPVRPDGKISTPLVEDLPATGRDSTTLAREIEKELAKFIRDPVVTVIVGRLHRAVLRADPQWSARQPSRRLCLTTRR